MSTLIKSATTEAIEREYVALHTRAKEISSIKLFLSATPSEQLVYEVVIPCTKRLGTREVRIKRTENLSSLLLEAEEKWNSDNKGLGKCTRKDAYVFVVFSGFSIAVPGETVKQVTGYKTKTYKKNFETPSVVVPSERNGLV